MLISGNEYRERVESYDRAVYVRGSKSNLSHPNLQPVVNAIAYTYDLALEKSFKVNSAISGEEVNILNHVITSREELMLRYDYQRLLSMNLATCNYRCTGSDAINALYASLEGESKEKLERILIEIQKKDFACTAALTDPKGDRSKRPVEEKEMYVRVVREDSDGVYISGAKIHQSGAFAADLTFVLPTQTFKEGEEDFAIVFAIEAEDDVKYVLQNTGYQALFREEGEVEKGNPAYGDRITCMVVFNETFIPWERVLIYRDLKAIRNVLTHFASSHRCVGAACKAGFIDSMVGAASLMMKANGLEKAPALRYKLGEMIAASEAAYGIAAGGAFKGKAANGVWLPNPLIANAGKVIGVEGMAKAMLNLSEIAGGIPVTAPSEDDLKSEIGELVAKYLRGSKSFTPEQRLKIIKFIEFWLTSSHFVGAVHGGGSPSAALIFLQILADIESKEEAVKRNINILDI
jgi:4-hydroxyphenylacetate 3-monooxygenase/4-hydroxybutyryl-CoA dehydratase/vinylacetyl-CoA-Delta-isomerase